MAGWKEGRARAALSERLRSMLTLVPRFTLDEPQSPRRTVRRPTRTRGSAPPALLLLDSVGVWLATLRAVRDGGSCSMPSLIR